MVLYLGTIRPYSLSCFAPYRPQISLSTSSISLSKSGFSPFRRFIQACIRSENARGFAGAELPENQSEIIFLGTGTSEGIPRVSCLTNPLKTCEVCLKAAEPGNKNRRLNTSILIRYPSSPGISNILIDAGKFFYHSVLRWFPAYGLRTIDAVIITHSHADAIGGLCREGFLIFILKITNRIGMVLQKILLLSLFLFYIYLFLFCLNSRTKMFSFYSSPGLDDLRDWTNNVQPSIPIYVPQRDFEVMKKTHYYLVDTSVITPGAAVSALQFNIIEESPFTVHGLKITPLPVWHGHGYRSLGFRFGNICYISDVSEIPEETYPLLKDCEILILDALRPDRSSSTHFGLPKALEEVRKIQPKRTLFTGMMHLMDHEKVNDYLMKLMETEGLDVQLSYDGLRVPVTL